MAPESLYQGRLIPLALTSLVDENHDDAQALEERDDSGLLQARYVYGHDLISQPSPSTGSGYHSGTVTRYSHDDGLGSARALSNNNGAVTDTYERI